MDYGYLLHAHGAYRDQRGDGEAAEYWRVARTRRSNRSRSDDRLRREPALPEYANRWVPSDQPGLRQRGIERGATNDGARLQDHRHRGEGWRVVESEWHRYPPAGRVQVPQRTAAGVPR